MLYMNRWIFISCLVFISNLLLANKLKPSFKDGDRLPAMVFTDVFGKTMETDSLKGKKILLTFNRYVSCPLCNYHTHQILDYYDSLKKAGVIFISFYESSPKNLLQYVSQEEIPFIMVSDTDHAFYHQFGIGTSTAKTIRGLFHSFHKKHKIGKAAYKANYQKDGNTNQLTADFLIDENGIIRTAYYAKFVGDHIPIEKIIQWALE